MTFDVERLMKGVSPGTRSELSSRKVRQRFGARDDLLRLDEPAPGAFVITKGRVRSWRPLSDGRAVTLTMLGDGMVAGLVACARNSVSPTVVTAIGSVEAELWPVAVMRSLISEDAAFARNLLAMVADYSVLMMEKIDDGMAPVEQRLARALLRIACEHGDWRMPDRCGVALSRQELADLTGTTVFTASRTLSDWQRQGLVQSKRGRISILDPGGLERLADHGA